MAGIIKAGREPPAVKKPVQAFPFDDVGTSYVSRVRAEAAKIVQQARAEAARIKAQAAEAGKQEAIQAATAMLGPRLDQQVQSVLAALQEAVGKIEHARQDWQRYWEQHAAGLAAAIARRICRRELSQEQQIAGDWLREALELAAGSARVTVRLNPGDYATLGARVETLRKQLAALGSVEAIADPAISPGGCRVETEFGSIDQQLESQLARITEELVGSP